MSGGCERVRLEGCSCRRRKQQGPCSPASGQPVAGDAMATAMLCGEVDVRHPQVCEREQQPEGTSANGCRVSPTELKKTNEQRKAARQPVHDRGLLGHDLSQHGQAPDGQDTTDVEQHRTWHRCTHRWPAVASPVVALLGRNRRRQMRVDCVVSPSPCSLPVCGGKVPSDLAFCPAIGLHCAPSGCVLDESISARPQLWLLRSHRVSLHLNH